MCCISLYHVSNDTSYSCLSKHINDVMITVFFLELMSLRLSRRLFVRINTAQPEPMGGRRAGSLTLGPMGQKGWGHL